MEINVILVFAGFLTDRLNNYVEIIKIRKLKNLILAHLLIDNKLDIVTEGSNLDERNLF